MKTRKLLHKYIQQGKTSQQDLEFLLKLCKFETELRLRKKLKSNSISDSEENDEQIMLLESFLKTKLNE